MPTSLHQSVFLFLVLLSTLGIAPQTYASSADEVTRLTAALDDLDAWIGDGANGDKWRKYLRSAELRQEVEKGADADPAVVARVLQQYRSQANGLEKRRFTAVRQQLQSWYSALQNQYASDLPKLAWAARGEHIPVTDESFATVRGELRQTAQRLEQRLGIGTPFAENWKAYLKWPQLEPHFSEDQKINTQSLQALDQVLRRLRANQPGLENPVFSRLAASIERYRELALWHALAQRVDTRKRYEAFLKQLEKYLARNLEKPSAESTRQIDKILSTMSHLGNSPYTVEQIRSEFGRPNLFAEFSTQLLNQLGKRPVSETQPVVDCILGASVRGTANSCGTLSLRTLPAHDHIALELQLTGNIQSRTTSYKKPVKVGSLGSTNFIATKQLALNDQRFLIQPATASARTKTRTISIRKTGGRFGRRLVERIARKKVAESKSQSEYIGARHAEQRIAKKFDSQVVDAVYQAREKYDTKFRPPLQRIGMFPDHLLMASSSQDIRIETTLASPLQLAAPSLPPGAVSNSDIVMQVHESAINNFAPHFFGGAKISQESENQPPKVEGDIPSWLKQLSGAPEVKKQFAESSHEPTLADPTSGEDATEKKSDFKPWAFTLNRQHPFSVAFENDLVKLRVRFSQLETTEDGEKQARKNWDLLITYKIEQQDNGILLTRVGEVEPFPTGFDPDWLGAEQLGEKRLSPKNSGIRSVLRDNLKKRIEEQGEKNRNSNKPSFQDKIEIPAIQIPLAGNIKQTLQLRQVETKNGWLTVVYSL